MRLSVAIATYNEQENIENCLASVYNWCDEIVLVDGSSTDKTIEIVRKYNVRIIIAKNEKLFHINKQKAIELAKSDWILQLDADEIVTPELKKEIDNVIQEKTNNGFWIPRKNYFLGRFLMKGGVYPDYTLRLYKNGKARFPQKDVHEQVDIVGLTAYLKNPLIHMADKNLKRYFLRFGRYTDLLAYDIKQDQQFFIIKFFKYVFIKPIFWFLNTYFRHLGILDSWQGFLFSLFSSSRFLIAYFKSINL